jgi:hypothetical protein
LWLAAAVPWIAYVLSASGHAYWLDSGEFVAASVRLDIAHPPGHPLTELYGKLFTLLPIGSLPLRVAVGQAAATAIACAILCRATAAVLKLQAVREVVRWPCALFAAWASALTYGLWFQAVRPEVYALQTLCTSVIVERVASYLETRGQAMADSQRLGLPAARYAGPACFALALGLANHHFTALLVVPALVVPAFLLVRSGRLRALAGSALLGTLGLATYAYLPLRAARALPANLGHPDDWARFVWVVSARVYQHGAATQSTQPFSERLADVAVLLMESFRVLPLLAAAVGLYVLLRKPATRAAGLFALLVLAPNLIARAWLGPVRSNPDVLGYFGSTFLILGMLAACGLAELATQLVALARRWSPAGSASRRTAPPAAFLAFCLPALAFINLPFALARSSLADFHATDSIDDQRLRGLPPRSVVVETMPQTVFRHWELDAVERLRPDVLQVPVPFLTHPGMRDALLARSPSLARLVDGYLQGDAIRCGDLLAESRLRPTWLELDVRVPPDCYALLQPAALLHRVAPQQPVADVSAQLLATYEKLYADLGPHALREPETVRQLLAVHYLGAVQFAATGELDLARAEIAFTLALAPEDRNVRNLARALEQEHGPIAIAPFLDL